MLFVFFFVRRPVRGAGTWILIPFLLTNNNIQTKKNKKKWKKTEF